MSGADRDRPPARRRGRSRPRRPRRVQHAGRRRQPAALRRAQPRQRTSATTLGRGREPGAARAGGRARRSRTRRRCTAPRRRGARRRRPGGRAVRRRGRRARVGVPDGRRRRARRGLRAGAAGRRRRRASSPPCTPVGAGSSPASCRPRSRRWSAQGADAGRGSVPRSGPRSRASRTRCPAALRDEVAAVVPETRADDGVGHARARPAGRRGRGAARARASRTSPVHAPRHVDGPGALLATGASPRTGRFAGVVRPPPLRAPADGECRGVSGVSRRVRFAAVASVTGRGSPTAAE